MPRLVASLPPSNSNMALFPRLSLAPRSLDPHELWVELLSKPQQQERKDDAAPGITADAADAQEPPSEAAAVPLADTPSQLADLAAACEALEGSDSGAKAAEAVVEAIANAETEAEAMTELLTATRREGVTMLQLLRAHRRQRRMWEALRQEAEADAEADGADGQEGEDVWALERMQLVGWSSLFTLSCVPVQQVQRLGGACARSCCDPAQVLLVTAKHRRLRVSACSPPRVHHLRYLPPGTSAKAAEPTAATEPETAPSPAAAATSSAAPSPAVSPIDPATEGEMWQQGPACELAVPLALPLAMPLAVPLPPATQLPPSAAERDAAATPAGAREVAAAKSAALAAAKAARKAARAALAAAEVLVEAGAEGQAKTEPEGEFERLCASFATACMGGREPETVLTESDEDGPLVAATGHGHLRHTLCICNSCTPEPVYALAGVKHELLVYGT